MFLNILNICPCFYLTKKQTQLIFSLLPPELGGLTFSTSVVPNPRAADRHRSVAQSVPGRTRINYLFLFYLFSKSGTIIKGDPLLHLQLVGEEESTKYK